MAKGQILKPWKHNCTEYVGIIGNWKGHFISFENSIKVSSVSIMTEVMQLFLR
jgi:hypothetical protein